MSFVLILSATSDIGKQLAREYAKHGYNLILSARNVNDVKPLEKDLTIRNNIKVHSIAVDIRKTDTHKAVISQLNQEIIGVISAIGYLGDQSTAESDFQECQKIFETNFTGLVSLLNQFANTFAEKKSGFIIGISSVAADRGRQKNYIYGSAKAAFSCYLSGLRNRLNKFNVQVLTVLPGFVKTKMTKDMELPENLTAQPEEIAKAIFKAQQKSKDVLYYPKKWRWIMSIIKNIPEFIFKKLDL